MKNKIKSQKNKPFLHGLYAFVEKRQKVIFIATLVLASIVFYKLFDIRVNLAGDDTEYIVRAHNLITDGTYPTFQGALYPMFLSLLIILGGVNIVLMKIFSAFFLLGAYIVFYKAFKDRIHPFLLVSSFLLVGINAHVAYYTTFTFSEAMYMFIQSCLLVLVFRNAGSDRQSLPETIMIGVFCLALYMTRSVGLAGIASVVVFYLIFRQWKALGISLSSFAISYFIVSFIKKYVFKLSSSQIDGQLETLLQKHPYQPALGNEDFYGFIQRFIDNTGLYISKHFFRFIGFKPIESMDATIWHGLLVFVFIIGALLYSFRKNKYIFFTVLYVGAFLSITFLFVQTFWDQDRLLVPIYPLLLLTCLSFFFYLGEKNNLAKVFFIFIWGLMLIKTISHTNQQLKANEKVLTASLKGDRLYGFTPDWVNYCRMSEYVKNLPDTALVACRKAGISFIFGERKFMGIYGVPTSEIESFMDSKKTYYTIALSKAQEKAFPKDWIKGVFHGESKTSKYLSNQYYLLIESETSNMASFEDYRTTKEQLSEGFENLTVYSPDHLLEYLKSNSVDYVIMANLRIDPRRKTNQIISTIPRYMQIISLKYPDFAELVYAIGEDEKAVLFQIK